MDADPIIDENLQILRQCAFAIGTFSERSSELFHSMNWIYEHFKKSSELMNRHPQTLLVIQIRRHFSGILIEQAKLFDEICKLCCEVGAFKKMLEPHPMKRYWLFKLLFR